MVEGDDRSEEMEGDSYEEDGFEEEELQEANFRAGVSPLSSHLLLHLPPSGSVGGGGRRICKSLSLMSHPRPRFLRAVISFL